MYNNIIITNDNFIFVGIKWIEDMNILHIVCVSVCVRVIL